MSAENKANSGINLKPLRITGMVFGGVVMTFSLVGWFPYLGASLSGFDPGDTRSAVTDKSIVEAFLLFWIVSWTTGLFIVLAAIAGWLRRARWTLLGLTGVMLAITLITYGIGAA